MKCLCELFKGQWPAANVPSRQLLARGYVAHPDFGDSRGMSDEQGTPTRAEGYGADPNDVSDPLVGGYVSPLTMTRSSAMVGPGPAFGDPPLFLRGSPLHAPTDRVTPIYPALSLARGLQRVDSCTPNTDWQHNYGYQVIADNQVPALEGPRYSYAAIDTNDLLDEARARVLGALR